ncbi:hypothetical protein B1A_06983, partial [mine drainage metagenome]
GLYDLLLTEGLARSLADLDPTRADVSALKGGATLHKQHDIVARPTQNQKLRSR